jgi:hypothetical protein
VILGLLLGFSINLFYALIFQRFLLLKTSKRMAGAVSALSILASFPLFIALMTGIRGSYLSSIWFLSFMPMAAKPLLLGTGSIIALLAQWTLIVLVTAEMTQKLKTMGYSESKRLRETSAQFSFSK